MISSLILKRALILLLFFIFLYGPPFKVFPVNISTSIAVFAYTYLIQTGELIKGVKAFKNEIILLFIICLYSILCSIVSGDVSLLYFPFFLLFANLPTCIWLYALVYRNAFRHSDDIYPIFIRYLSIVGFSAATISVYLALNVDLAEYVKFQLLKYDQELLQYQSERAFGLSDELLFSYSLAQGIILMLMIREYGFTWKVIFASFMILASILLNARVGLIVLAFSPFLLHKINYKVVLLGILVASILFISNWDTQGSILFERLVGQLESFYQEISYAIFAADATGSIQDTSSLYILLREMIFFPSEWHQVIFGAGQNIFSESLSSDSGYIMMIFYGGVVYVGLVMAFIILNFARAVKIGAPLFAITLITYVFVMANVKGMFFAPKPGMHIYMLVYVFIILSTLIRKRNISLPLIQRYDNK